MFASSVSHVCSSFQSTPEAGATEVPLHGHGHQREPKGGHRGVIQQIWVWVGKCFIHMASHCLLEYATYLSVILFLFSFIYQNSNQ